MLFHLMISVLLNPILCWTEEWDKMFNTFTEYESKRIESDIDFIVSVYQSTAISSDCRKSINQTLEALRRSELFAYQIYDSWPQFPPKAILEGTVNDFGDYDQCLSVRPNPVIGRTQFCLIRLSVPLPKPKTVHTNLNHKIDPIVVLFQNRTSEHLFAKLADNAVFFRLFDLRLGLCMPGLCDQKDIEFLAEKAFEISGLLLQEVDCNTKIDSKLNAAQIIALYELSGSILKL